MSKKRDIPVFNHAIIETHCHLDYLKEVELEEIVERSQAAGVERIITISVAPGNLDTVLNLTRQHDMIYGTQGVHPHEAEKFTSDTEAQIREQALDPRILAIGEIGLDYFYDHADRKVQQRVFETQLQIASDLDLPVVIHSREADEDNDRHDASDLEKETPPPFAIRRKNGVGGLGRIGLGKGHRGVSSFGISRFADCCGYRG